MSQPGVIRELYVPGRLVWNPMDLTAAYPYGGTALGRSTGPVVLVGEDVDETFEYEAEGARPVFTLDLGSVWSVGVTIRGLDPDALARVITGTVTASGAAGTDQAIITETTMQHVGAEKATGKLMLAADFPVQHKSLICYAAVPTLAPDHQIRFRRSEELGVGLSFLLQPDAARRVFQLALIEEMTL